MIKKKKLLLLLLLVGGIAVIDSNQSNLNQCYCSYACEFRDKQEGDVPFICPETGVCFCKQRDQDTYFEHSCDKKNNSFSEQTYCSMEKDILKS